jgi:hypothetical protein
MDMDGRPEIALGNPGRKNKAGAVSLVSSKDGKPLWTVSGASGELFGDGIHRCADADRDGMPDLVVLAPGARLDGTKGRGRVRILSGKTGQTLAVMNPLLAK